MMLIVAADFRRLPHMLSAEPGKGTCNGYTIIEYDKGVDCQGDTIQLIRKNGYAERL